MALLSVLALTYSLAMSHDDGLLAVLPDHLGLGLPQVAADPLATHTKALRH